MSRGSAQRPKGQCPWMEKNDGLTPCLFSQSIASIPFNWASSLFEELPTSSPMRPVFGRDPFAVDRDEPSQKRTQSERPNWLSGNSACSFLNACGTYCIMYFSLTT